MDDRFYAEVESVTPAAKPGGRLRLLFVGQLGPRKGPQDLLEAYIALPAELQARGEVVILGRGPLEAPLRARAEAAGLGGSVEVRFCPYEHLPAEYAAADVFIHPARWPEPAGATRLEAMAFSLPILSSENPSAREIMGDDGALYYRAFDVEHLGEQLARLMRSSDLREQIGSAGRRRLGNHETQKIIAQYLDVYRRVMRERGAAGAHAPRAS
jgi:glycosyltransferase involved in cell wall biosynthesis